MGVIFQSPYTLPGPDQPLTHARISHSGNWLAGGTVAADDGSNLLMELGDDLLLEDGTFILLENANATATGYFPDGPKTSLTYEKWKPTAIPATWEYNHGSSVSCDNVCIGAHTLGTNGNTLTVQYWTGAAWSNLCPATAITNDMAIMVIFAPVTAQRWRISLTNGTAPTIGVIKFGLAMQMSQAIYGGHTPIEMGRQTLLRSNMSETGEFLGRTKLRTQMASGFSFAHLTDSWVRTNWRPFQKAIESEPFFIAWRPGTHSEVALCQSDSVPVPQNMGIKDLMSVEMSVRALAYD